MDKRVKTYKTWMNTGWIPFVNLFCSLVLGVLFGISYSKNKQNKADLTSCILNIVWGVLGIVGWVFLGVTMGVSISNAGSSWTGDYESFNHVIEPLGISLGSFLGAFTYFADGTSATILWKKLPNRAQELINYKKAKQEAKEAKQEAKCAKLGVEGTKQKEKNEQCFTSENDRYYYLKSVIKYYNKCIWGCLIPATILMIVCFILWMVLGRDETCRLVFIILTFVLPYPFEWAATICYFKRVKCEDEIIKRYTAGCDDLIYNGTKYWKANTIAAVFVNICPFILMLICNIIAEIQTRVALSRANDVQDNSLMQAMQNFQTNAALANLERKERLKRIKKLRKEAINNPNNLDGNYVAPVEPVKTPNVSANPTPSSSKSPTDRLKEAQEMLKAGLINEADFAKLKEKIMAEM